MTDIRARFRRLRIDRSKIRWRAKLAGAFDNKVEVKSKKDQREAKSSKWTLFLLPLITVLREGLEAVVFVGGVSLGQSAKSIPLAAIVGIFSGFIVGCEQNLSLLSRSFLQKALIPSFPADFIYASGSRVNLSIFLVVSTQILYVANSSRNLESDLTLCRSFQSAPRCRSLLKSCR